MEAPGGPWAPLLDAHKLNSGDLYRFGSCRLLQCLKGLAEVIMAYNALLVKYTMVLIKQISDLFDGLQ